MSETRSERDINLGSLDDDELENIPEHWVVFARIVVFTNGPVMYVYDKRVDDRLPPYIIQLKIENWEQVIQMMPGDIYHNWGIDLGMATEQIVGKRGKDDGPT